MESINLKYEPIFITNLHITTSMYILLMSSIMLPAPKLNMLTYSPVWLKIFVNNQTITHKPFCHFLLRRAVDSTKPTKKLVMILGKMKMVDVILWILIRHFSSFGKKKNLFWKLAKNSELFYFGIITRLLEL